MRVEIDSEMPEIITEMWTEEEETRRKQNLVGDSGKVIFDDTPQPCSLN